MISCLTTEIMSQRNLKIRNSVSEAVLDLLSKSH